MYGLRCIRHFTYSIRSALCRRSLLKTQGLTQIQLNIHTSRQRPHIYSRYDAPLEYSSSKAAISQLPKLRVSDRPKYEKLIVLGSFLMFVVYMVIREANNLDEKLSNLTTPNMVMMPMLERMSIEQIEKNIKVGQSRGYKTITLEQYLEKRKLKESCS